MIFLTRLLAIGLLVFGGLGFGGVLLDPPGQRDWSLMAVFVPMISGAIALWIHAARRSARDARVERNRRLLELGRKSGTLTVADVVVGLSLTSEEANAALTQLSRDGLAQFEVDGEGASIWKLAHLSGETKRER